MDVFCICIRVYVFLCMEVYSYFVCELVYQCMFILFCGACVLCRIIVFLKKIVPLMVYSSMRVCYVNGEFSSGSLEIECYVENYV